MLSGHTHHVAGDVWLNPAFRESRAAQDVHFLLLGHLFGLGYRRVERRADAGDTDARTDLPAMGFHLDGVLRKHMIVKVRACSSYPFFCVDALVGSPLADLFWMHVLTCTSSCRWCRAKADEWDIPLSTFTMCTTRTSRRHVRAVTGLKLQAPNERHLCVFEHQICPPPQRSRCFFYRRPLLLACWHRPQGLQPRYGGVLHG